MADRVPVTMDPFLSQMFRDFQALLIEIRSVQLEENGSIVPLQVSQYLCDCEEMLGFCVRLERELDSPSSELMQAVMRSLQELISFIESRVIQPCNSHGRPRISVSGDLCTLISNDFNLADMASIIGCSRRTVQTRLE